MTQENSIIPVDANLPAQRFTVDEFNNVNVSTSYLPRIQVMGASSTPCKEGKFPVGNWALAAGQTLVNLGPTLTAAILSWRPKALDMRDIKKIVSVFDAKHPKFAEIRNVAENAAKGTLSGCMFGPEFLIWLPDHKKFVSYMMANNSAQQEAPNVLQLIGKLATLNVVFIPSKTYGGWHAPKSQPCSTPMAEPIDPVALKREMDKFLNPPQLETEIPEEEVKAAGADRAR